MVFQNYVTCPKWHLLVMILSHQTFHQEHCMTSVMRRTGVIMSPVTGDTFILDGDVGNSFLVTCNIVFLWRWDDDDDDDDGVMYIMSSCLWWHCHLSPMLDVRITRPHWSSWAWISGRRHQDSGIKSTLFKEVKLSERWYVIYIF